MYFRLKFFLLNIIARKLCCKFCSFSNPRNFLFAIEIVLHSLFTKLWIVYSRFLDGISLVLHGTSGTHLYTFKIFFKHLCLQFVVFRIHFPLIVIYFSVFTLFY